MIQLPRGGGLGSSYQEGRVGIQLPRGEVWDPVTKRGGLGSSYQEGRFVIQLPRGEVCDPVTKRGRVGIQLPRGEVWDPINRFNPATFLCLSQDIDFQHHMTWSFRVQ